MDDGDGWVIEERLFSGAGASSVRSYYFREQLAIRHELKTVGARRLSGLTLIEKDIRTLTAWIATLRALTTELTDHLPETKSAIFMPKDDRTVIVRGLFVAVLATYGKMFTQAEGRGAMLDPAACGSDAEHVETHDWLMHQRHTFAAHSGVDSAEGCRIAAAIDFKGRTPLRLFSELHQPATIAPESLDKISALLGALHASVNAKLVKATKFAYREAQEALPEATLKRLRKGARGWLLQRKGTAITTKDRSG